MATGKIKWYSDEKGFGFIEQENGADVFFKKDYAKGSPDSLQEGCAVSFDIEESERGPVARNIVLA